MCPAESPSSSIPTPTSPLQALRPRIGATSMTWLSATSPSDSIRSTTGLTTSSVFPSTTISSQRPSIKSDLAASWLSSQAAIRWTPRTARCAGIWPNARTYSARSVCPTTPSGPTPGRMLSRILSSSRNENDPRWKSRNGCLPQRTSRIAPRRKLETSSRSRPDIHPKNTRRRSQRSGKVMPTCLFIVEKITSASFPISALQRSQESSGSPSWSMKSTNTSWITLKWCLETPRPKVPNSDGWITPLSRRRVLPCLSSSMQRSASSRAVICRWSSRILSRTQTPSNGCLLILWCATIPILW